MSDKTDIKKIMSSIIDKNNDILETKVTKKYIIKYTSKNYSSQINKIIDSDLKLANELKRLDSLNLNSDENLNFENSFTKELDQINLSYDIQHYNKIDTSKPQIIRNIVLKIRNILQNEIRFTLNPITDKQVKFNIGMVKILNELSKSHDVINQLKTQYQKLENNNEKIEAKNNQLKNDFDHLQTTNDHLQTTNDHLQTTNIHLQTTNIHLQTTNVHLQTTNVHLQTTNDHLQTNYKKLEEENLTSYIQFLYANLLNRNPSKNEIKHWQKLFEDGIQFNQINELIQESAEAKTKHQKFLKSLGIKKNTYGFYKILEDYKIYFDVNDPLLLDSYSQSNFHEAGTVSLIKKILHPKMNVLNIGANVGFYSLLSAKLVGSMGKIFAFEPGLTALEFLELNVRINNFSNITIIPKAVSNFTGNSDLFIHESITGNSLFSFDKGVTEKISTPTISIDKFLEEQDFIIDLLIIDAEGAEQLILEGSQNTLKTNPRLDVILEFNPKSLELAGTNVKLFLEFITQLGFSIFIIDEFEETIKPKSSFEILQDIKEDEHFNLYLTKQNNNLMKI